ncbi:heavy metal transporter [Tersicoccus phoenicis]|uniref:Heavy metal transporter n=1 Tax=Tersicoccus phoenicis TaxID=554083 RepID=A0A1R1LJP8_9MICC|nr:cation transporter [Tersicoccus phoenicis]OMH27739.1 heavy metal transporter [Tersicoccus phoenicis]
MTTTVKISGMTCGHCVSSVTEELTALDGVENVSVDLVNGGVSTARITTAAPVSESAISEAIAEAGYVMVGADAD